jgi:hypothetical protein
MPATFELVHHERVPFFGRDLVLWIKQSHHHGMSGRP